MARTLEPAPSIDGLIAWLRAYAARSTHPLPESGEPAVWSGMKPSLDYAASATTAGMAEIPEGTGSVALLVTGGFSSLTLTGETTGFAYITLTGSGNGQLFSSPWHRFLDVRAKLSIVAAAGQGGTVYLTCFPSIVPALPAANSTGTAFASLSRAAGTYTFDLPIQTSYRGIIVFSSVSGGTGTVTTTIFVRDPLSGSQNAELISGAQAAATTQRYEIYPGVTVVANFTTSAVIGPNNRIQCVVATNPTTFQTTYQLIP